MLLSTACFQWVTYFFLLYICIYLFLKLQRENQHKPITEAEKVLVTDKGSLVLLPWKCHASLVRNFQESKRVKSLI